MTSPFVNSLGAGGANYGLYGTLHDCNHKGKFVNACEVLILTLNTDTDVMHVFSRSFCSFISFIFVILRNLGLMTTHQGFITRKSVKDCCSMLLVMQVCE